MTALLLVLLWVILPAAFWGGLVGIFVGTSWGLLAGLTAGALGWVCGALCMIAGEADAHTHQEDGDDLSVR